MSGVIELFGWFVFNVAIPLFAPLALLSLVSVPAFFSAHRHGMLRHAVKDGQLFWAAIPMSASACYMLASGIEGAGGLLPVFWIAMAFHVVIIVGASVLVSFATLDVHLQSHFMLRREPDVPWASIVAASGSGGAYFACYAYLIRP